MLVENFALAQAKANQTDEYLCIPTFQISFQICIPKEGGIGWSIVEMLKMSMQWFVQLFLSPSLQ